MFNWYVINFFSKDINIALKKLYFFIKKKNLEVFFSTQVVYLGRGPLNESFKNKGGFFFLKINFKGMCFSEYLSFVNFLPNTGISLQFSYKNRKPLPLKLNETLGFIDKKTSRVKSKDSFKVGGFVTITKGPFSNLKACIQKINRTKKKIEVNVSIFGRLTPVELEYNQIKNLK